MGPAPGRVLFTASAIVASLAVASGARAATIVATSGTPLPSVPGLTQSGTVGSDGTPSACGSFNKLAPTGPDQPATSFRYTAHTLSNIMNAPACITATFATACTGTNAIFSVAYIPAFVPANPLTNYAADLGDPPPGDTTYSFNAMARTSFAIIVHEVNAGQGCSGYNLTLTSQGPYARNRPTIGGSSAVGETLTATPGVWAENPPVAGRWRRCDRGGSTGCVDIPGATGTTYTLTADDLGRTVRYREATTEAAITQTVDSDYVDPFIPFVASTQSLQAGDRTQNGFLARAQGESRCGAPVATPTITDPASLFLYDVTPITSLLNEETCLISRTAPLSCTSRISTALYSPAYDPTAITANFRGYTGGSALVPGTAAWLLAPGATGEVVAHGTLPGASCASYSHMLGTDTPFATARPAIAGTPAQGQPLTASDGTWSGTPALGRQWLRCAGVCEPIPGANGATYTPTEAGVRVGLRVSATQGRTVSSDAAPTGPVAAAPAAPVPAPLLGPVPFARDTKAPTVRITVAKTSLRAVRKRGSLPVLLTCDEACRVSTTANVTRRLGRRLGGTRIAATTTTLRANRRTTVRVKLTRKARRGLRTRRELSFTFRLTAADAANNRRTASKRVKVRQPRRR